MTRTQLLATCAPVCGLIGVIAWRIREARSAVTMRKIVAPPLGMATGFCMFAAPVFRIPWSWAATSLALGAGIMAYPLLRTSRLVLHAEDGTVTIHRSPAFLFVIVGLALVRYFARNWMGEFMSLPQTGGLFFILAFGMIARWRWSMLQEYRKLTQPFA